MKKFILGAISSIGVLGLGKIVYDKGHKDGVESMCNFMKGNLESMRAGLEMGKETDEESK